MHRHGDATAVDNGRFCLLKIAQYFRIKGLEDWLDAEVADMAEVVLGVLLVEAQEEFIIGQIIGEAEDVRRVVVIGEIAAEADPVVVLGTGDERRKLQVAPVGIFAVDKITGTATGNGLLFGGGFKLLGAQAIGGHATELISEAALAIRNELTLDEVGNTIHCHPTLSEAWMEAAHAFHNACIHLPKR